MIAVQRRAYAVDKAAISSAWIDTMEPQGLCTRAGTRKWATASGVYTRFVRAELPSRVGGRGLPKAARAATKSKAPSEKEARSREERRGAEK